MYINSIYGINLLVHVNVEAEDFKAAIRVARMGPGQRVLGFRV